MAREGQKGETAMTYHIERDSTALYIWRDGGPCVAILPRENWAEAEQLAGMLLAAANGEEGEK